MTPIEIQSALKLLVKRIGSDAHVSASIDAYGVAGKAISAYVYPRGILHDSAFSVRSNDWQELIALLNEQWNEHRDGFQAERIKAMALAIIRLTDEHGECTDQMLRAEFDAGDVTAFMDRAIERADAMAANGPFTVRRVDQSNAA